MTAQIEFTEALFRPDPIDTRILALKAHLRDAGWLNAKQIKATLGFSDRLTRQLAEGSSGEIISGQQGYKLTSQATPEEVTAATAWLESQARKMSIRAGSIRRVWHACDRRSAH